MASPTFKASVSAVNGSIAPFLFRWDENSKSYFLEERLKPCYAYENHTLIQLQP